MVEYRSQLEGREPHIERHDDGAGEQHAEVTFQKLVRIEAEIRDAVALLNAFGKQAGGQALAPLAELAVGEAMFPADDSGLAAVKIDGPV